MPYGINSNIQIQIRMKQGAMCHGRTGGSRKEQRKYFRKDLQGSGKPWRSED